MRKRLHQIWVTDTPIPEHIEQYMSDLASGLPEDWEYIKWTDENLPKMVYRHWSPGFQDAFNRETKGAMKADLLRVWILIHYGGIYLDADFEHVGGIETIDVDWDNIEGVLLFHKKDNPTWGMDNTMPNGCWGLSEGSKLGEWLKASVEEAVIKHKGPIWLGPSWLGEQVRSFVGVELDTPHEEVGAALAERGYAYLPFSDFEKTAYRHHDLFSWEWDDKLKGKPKPKQ